VLRRFFAPFEAKNEFCETFTEKTKKIWKKVLTNEEVFDIIDKLTSRGDFRVALAL